MEEGEGNVEAEFVGTETREKYGMRLKTAST
jgi:hypothetical protein